MAVIEFVVPRGTVRMLAEGALAIGGCVAAMMWVRATRVALDLLEWCDCASLTVRVIVPLAAESPSLDAVAETPVPIESATREELEAEVEALAGPRVS